MSQFFRNLPRYFRTYITPFNMVLVAIAATAIYIGAIALQNLMLLRQMGNAAPDHVVRLTESAEKNADLTVTLFYDYSCIWCYEIDPVIQAAAKTDGHVELLFKFVPFLDGRSREMGRIAYAAGQQGRFLDVHNYFMQNGNRPYTEEDIRIMAEELGLDYERLVRDSESQAADDKIQENMDLALKLRVFATPTLLVGSTFFTPEGSAPEENDILELFNRARQNQ